jgi:hypothetical protein
MTKSRIHRVFQVLILSAAVAVFSGFVTTSFSNSTGRNLPALRATGGETLIADGSDPVPAPKPLPWLGVAS